MDKKKITCINCPLGCSMEVEISDSKIVVSGNRCKRGEEYAVNEIRDPKRVVTSTVRVAGGNKALTSVKTDGEVPKRLIFDVMNAINNIKVNAPVNVGDLIIENVLGTGVNILSTARVEKKEE